MLMANINTQIAHAKRPYRGTWSYGLWRQACAGMTDAVAGHSHTRPCAGEEDCSARADDRNRLASQ